MANLTSTLTVSLLDQVSKPARSVAQALKDAEARVKEVSKAMASTGSTDRFTAALSKLKASSKDIETVANAWKDYAKASNLAADSSKWTRRQANDVKAWERQQISALREVKREQQAFYRAQADAERQATARRNRPGVASRVMNHVAGPMAVVGAGAAGERGVQSIVREAADAEQLRFRIRELSRGNPSEAALADRLAAEIATKYPGITTGKALDNYIELRANSVDSNGMVDPKVARRNAFAAARAQNAATALGFDMSSEDMQSLLKGVEGSGRAEDPKAVEKITDAYIRAKQVFGSAIAASMVRDYVANAKSANFSIGDDQFYLANMVRMSEGNSSRLGNEVNQTLSTLAGGSMKRASGDWLVGLGLADANDMVKTGGGNVKFKKGIKDSALLETDQGAWAAGTLKEAIERKGVISDAKVEARMKMLREQELKRNPNAQIDERFLRTRAEEGLISGYIAKGGFRTTVSDNLAHLISNERLIERDTKAMKNASGLEAGDRLAENPVAAFKELTASLTNFATVLGSPAMKNVGSILDTVAGSIGSFSKTLGDWQKENPELAKIMSGGAIAGGAGGSLALLYGGIQGLTSGFGLKGSAVALDGSAEALTAAAVRLGGGGLPGTGPGSRPGGPGNAPGPGGARMGWLGFNLLGAAWNMPSTPEEFKKQAESNDRLQTSFGGSFKKHLPSWLFPEKALWEKSADEMPSWMSPGKRYMETHGAAPKVDVDDTKLNELGPTAEKAKQALDTLGAPVAVNVDSSSISSAQTAAEKLLATLRQVGPMAASAVRSVELATSKAEKASSGLRASLGASHPTGHFGAGPVQDH